MFEVRLFISFFSCPLINERQITTACGERYKFSFDVRNENENYIPILWHVRCGISHNMRVHLCIFFASCISISTLCWSEEEEIYMRECKCKFIAHTLCLCSAHLNDLWCDRLPCHKRPRCLCAFNVRNWEIFAICFAVSERYRHRLIIFAASTIINNRQLYANRVNRFVLSLRFGYDFAGLR